jgi:hypothetical protein
VLIKFDVFLERYYHLELPVSGNSAQRAIIYDDILVESLRNHESEASTTIFINETHGN